MESKTLIIHPEDSSTDFLKVIYKEIFNCKVISGGNISKLKLQSEIKNAENIILIGHGDAFGLFGNNNEVAAYNNERLFLSLVK